MGAGQHEVRLMRSSDELPPGTPFQREVWAALLTIPIGEVRTYRDIAEHIGRPTAARAVANACGANPDAPRVPCHRVVASNGQLGGYSGPGGRATKRAYLREEGVDVEEPSKRYPHGRIREPTAEATVGVQDLT